MHRVLDMDHSGERESKELRLGGWSEVSFSHLGNGQEELLLWRRLVGEEAGEGLSEAADGLGFGLVVGRVSS